MAWDVIVAELLLTHLEKAAPHGPQKEAPNQPSMGDQVADNSLKTNDPKRIRQPIPACSSSIQVL